MNSLNMKNMAHMCVNWFACPHALDIYEKCIVTLVIVHLIKYILGLKLVTHYYGTNNVA